MIGQVIFFSTFGGVASLIGAVGILLWKKKLSGYMGEITSFAAGVLLSVAILDLLPEAVKLGDINLVSVCILGGILFLFMMEKTSLWFHHHHEPHGKFPNIGGVWVGDVLHNFIDGLAIGSAFLISTPAGIATALAVGLHELPKEMADFGLYIKAGFSNSKTIILNLLSSLTAIVGAVGVYVFGENIRGVEGYLLAFTTGMFLYIALADLIPDLHQEESRKRSLIQLLIFFFGMGLAFMSFSLLE